jgi:hypothetical protein
MIIKFDKERMDRVRVKTYTTIKSRRRGWIISSRTKE